MIRVFAILAFAVGVCFMSGCKKESEAEGAAETVKDTAEEAAGAVEDTVEEATE